MLFTVTIDWWPKFVPFSTISTPAEPAMAAGGDAETMVGTLLGAGVIVNVSTVFDVPPPGCVVKTRTVAVPGFAIRLAGICVVIVLVVRKVVTSALPFHSTSEPGEKSFPITVKVNTVPPACAVVGDIELSTGLGKLICC